MQLGLSSKSSAKQDLPKPTSVQAIERVFLTLSEEHPLYCLLVTYFSIFQSLFPVVDLSWNLYPWAFLLRYQA